MNKNVIALLIKNFLAVDHLMKFLPTILLN